MTSELAPRLYYISDQAAQLPNDIGIRVGVALDARRAHLAGVRTLAHARTLQDTSAHHGVRRAAIANGESSAGGALQYAMRTTLQATSLAAQLCAIIGRNDLVCEYRAHTHHALAAGAADTHDPQAWRALADGLAAAAALARGFEPHDRLGDRDLQRARELWPELVDAIIVAFKGPAPRASEGAHAAFVLDLQELTGRLRGGNHRYGNETWRLTFFGKDSDFPELLRAFGVGWGLWRGHGVVVSRAEIDGAGYASLANALRAAGDNSTHGSACDVMNTLGQPFASAKPQPLNLLKPWQTQKVMPAVADFLERLVGIIECRPP
jgi:hypothetical protein